VKFQPYLAPGFPDREAMRQKAVELRLAGRSVKQIAEALGFKSGGRTLYEWLKEVPAPEWTKRPRAKDDVRDIAVAMRGDGRSYREIQEVTGVSKSTLSGWLKDLPLTEEQRLSLLSRKTEGAERRAAAIKAQHRAVRARIIKEAFDQVQQVAESELFVAGVAAYQAEGAKEKPWRPSALVCFMNSDPGLIRLFVRWLDLLGYQKKDLLLRLSIHHSGDERKALRFWSDVVGYPIDSFQKTVFKRHNPRTSRKNRGEGYYGCLTIKVRKSTELNRQIAGWFQGIVASLSKGSGDPDCRIDGVSV
jgi:hypothetical protein